MAITRLWFFTLQPNRSATDPAFLDLCTNVLELCASYTPVPVPSSSSQVHLLKTHPRRPHHFLFQSASGASPNEAVFVLISTYPSLAFCSQAETACSQRYMPEMLTYARHQTLRQMDMEDAEVVPAILSSGLATTATTTAGGGNDDGDETSEPATVTLTISGRDPLKSEVAEYRSSSSGDSRGTPIAPPDQEISGADVYVPGGEKPWASGAQKKEGRKWIRISRGSRPGDGGDGEVFRLRKLLSR